ncbi:uncharacterized protein V1516DRAFT_694069 [Lipomyces oligophaga]|uniref:uncharacterized protein n=1 Tax=Lipomyces oligophaga TaxID=45792 RepID=UPI0034CDB8AF
MRQIQELQQQLQHQQRQLTVATQHLSAVQLSSTENFANTSSARQLSDSSHSSAVRMHNTDAPMMKLSAPGAQTLPCQWDSCDVTVEEIDGLLAHIKHDHMMADISVPSNELLSSAHTPSLSTPADPVHQLGSSDDQVLECHWGQYGTICNAVFSSTHDLSEHIISTHIGSRKQQYTCLWDGCERNSRPFVQRQKIIRHLQVHTHDRPFACDVCGKRFAEQLVLTQHKRVHSGEKPFQCKICGKQFAVSTALSVHLRTHTGEKPLKCKWPGCDRSFSESSNLAKHMRTHTANRKFKCTIEGCGKEFLRNDQLVRHMKTHDNKIDSNGRKKPREQQVEGLLQMFQIP